MEKNIYKWLISHSSSEKKSSFFRQAQRESVGGPIGETIDDDFSPIFVQSLVGGLNHLEKYEFVNG